MAGTMSPAAAAAAAVNPAGYGPASLRSAYKLTTSGTTGTVVAVVDAYNDPNAESDLATYRANYGLPACTTANGCFRKVNQSGSTTSLPVNNSSWAGEISLDLDMVSAICPNCSILLVEASSNSNPNLYAAVDRAVAMGAKFVSNSWGGSEASNESSSDAHFNHPGVAITASTGDSGYGAAYPASSPYVTAVGGTSLTAASNARGWNETAWAGGGSGCSAYEAKPSFQSSVSTSCTRRAEADVAAVADPQTGVAVYQTYGGSGWSVYGGTSAAAPIIAGVYALAGTPGGADGPNNYPYNNRGALNDVTSGSNGSCGNLWCKAGSGWDGPTGLGTPIGTTAFAPSGTSGVTITNPGAQAATIGSAFSLTLSARGGSGSYSWTGTGLPPGLSLSTAGVVSGKPSATGSFAVTVTGTSGLSSSSIKKAVVATPKAKSTASDPSSGVAAFTITVGAAGSIACPVQQLLSNPGFETGGAAPWVTSSGVVSTSSDGESPHAGTYYAWLDGYGTTHTDSLTQTVAIPAPCTKSTLSFWLKIDTAETGTVAKDVLTVKMGTATLATYSNANAGAYSKKTFNVGAFAGKTVTVSFSGAENSSRFTSFVLDDTALTTG